jgi:hypothetical protein
VSTVRELLDQLAAGDASIGEVAADFRTREWPPVNKPTMDQRWLGDEGNAPGDDDWALVEADSRLSPANYALLVAAHSDARPADLLDGGRAA